uniref:Uncharacterized protein LOC102802785 n=1 Tax=Saccoglossus kowalevskii TaxID=10224 RepID=A0ABM0MCQ6_SACKO|nr:PREDICTED: uncharacterized protein LOC102802785 [Saccoglossus kowalevskii]
MSARGTRPAYRGKMTQLLKKAEDTIVKFNSEDDVDWDNLLITKEHLKSRTSWASNCEQLRDLTKADNVADLNTEVHILGLRWKTLSDELTYANNISNDKTILPTKREVSSATSSVYDPFGYLAPVVIKAKIFTQELWKRKLDWDEPLPSDLTNEWNAILTDLKTATNITMNREYFSDVYDRKDDHELHVFVDASTRAYGAAVYLRNNNTEQTSLVMSKTRAAPLKKQTLPRLELMGAVIGTRLIQFVSDALKDTVNITKHIIWSDSQIVLHWLKSDKKLPLFVTNRVNEIKTFPMTMNTVLHTFVETDTAQDTTTVNETTNVGIQHIIDADRFSSLNKLLRTTALVLRFVSNLRNDKHTSSTLSSTVSAEELRKAETKWIRDIQREAFSADVTTHRRKPTLTRQLGLFFDNDTLLRCGGRLHNAPLDYNTKFPILLPYGHRYTILVVLESHSRMLHSGLLSTVTDLRQTYWIPKIRQLVKRIIRQCVTCRKITGKPYQQPIQAPLQHCRVNDAPPFTVTGVDFTGALYTVANDSFGTGVTCNSICPAEVLTGLNIAYIKLNATASGLSYEECEKKLLQESNPNGKFVTIEQVAGLAVFLCSPAADQITGASIPIDAGRWVK